MAGGGVGRRFTVHQPYDGRFPVSPRTSTTSPDFSPRGPGAFPCAGASPFLHSPKGGRRLLGTFRVWPAVSACASMAATLRWSSLLLDGSMWEALTFPQAAPAPCPPRHCIPSEFGLRSSPDLRSRFFFLGRGLSFCATRRVHVPCNGVWPGNRHRTDVAGASVARLGEQAR